MQTSGSGYAVDTSVAVAAAHQAHSAHRWCRSAVVELRPKLAGHAAFETFSVLTRMPSGAITTPAAVSLLDSLFGDPLFLSPEESLRLLQRLGPLGVGGGSVYDALVAEAARTREATLLTRDRRALRTYDLVGVRYDVLDR